MSLAGRSQPQCLAQVGWESCAFGTLSVKYAQARAQHDLQTEAVVCGEAVGLLRDRPTAESIVNSMVTQAEELLRNGGTLRFTP